MKTETEKQRNIRQQGVIDEANYHINPENVTHITAILRNMYSAPVLAVIREYSANAVDAHVQASIARLPIEVTLPTDLEPIFKVRDFGGGLDKEQTKNLLYGFGSSGEHKRTSNEQIGGFGIGCKCAFAISDSFVYTVWHGGMKRVWTCYLDDHDNGKATLQSETESNEKAGIEVSIPVDSSLIPTFERYAATAFRFFDTKPVVHNADDIDIKFGTPEPAAVSNVKLKDKTDGSLWEVKVKFFCQEASDDEVPHWDQRQQRNAFRQELAGMACGVVMGGIRYALNLSDAGLADERDQLTWTAISKRIVIEAPIGWVQLAPNREALQYSKRTKAMFKSLFSVFTPGYLSKIFDVNADGLSINQRIGRIMSVEELTNLGGTAEDETSIKMMQKVLQKHAPNWEAKASRYRYVGSLPTFHFVGKRDPLSCRTDESAKAAWGLIQSVRADVKSRYTYNSGSQYYLEVPDPDQSSPQVISSGWSAGITGWAGGEMVLVNFISNKLHGELMETKGTEVYDVTPEKSKILGLMAVRELMYGDSHDRLTSAIKEHSDKLRHLKILTFRVEDEAGRQTAMKAFGFKECDTLKFSKKVLDEMPKGEELKEFRGYKRRPSSRRHSNTSSGGTQNYAQHKATWFKANNNEYATPKSQGWDSVDDISDLNWANKPDDFKMPVVVLDKFITDSFASDLVGWPGVGRPWLVDGEKSKWWSTLLGISWVPALRAKDFQKMKQENRVQSLGEALKEKVMEPILSSDHLKFIYWYANHKFGPYGARQDDTTQGRDILLGWYKSLDGRTDLNVSDEFKALIKEAVAFEEDPAIQWLCDTFLDGKRAQLDELMRFLKGAFQAFLSDPRLNKYTRTVGFAGDEKAQWYERAAVTTVAEVPQAWPLLLCDHRLRHAGGLKNPSAETDTPLLIGAFLIAHLNEKDSKALKGEIQRENKYRGFDSGHLLEKKYVRDYLTTTVLPQMTAQVTKTAETKETE